MGLNRFKSILRFIRFDDKSTRSERRKKDKLAPIRDLFNMIDANLSRTYSPGENLTVDEQLIPYRGRCPFKQYIPSKPDKYGMKMFWLCDAATGYPLKGIPYLGKVRNSKPSVGIAHTMVRELCRRYERTYRNITTDNYFTSYDLASELLGNGLTLVGTVRKNKRFIPTEFQPNRAREIGSNLFGFRKDITLMSFVPKKNKSVILLSTLHHSPSIDSQGKADINTFYNRTKGGVDILDQMCHTYSCQRGTNRWPFAFFMNLINVCGVAAFVIYNAAHDIRQEQYAFQRKKFLITLSGELIYDQILRRSTHGMTKSHRSTLKSVRESLNIPETSSSRTTQALKRACHLCPSTINRKTKTCCNKCNKNVCGEHSTTTVLCELCQKKRPHENNSSDSN